MKRRILLIIGVLIILLLPPSISAKIIIQEVRYLAPESHTLWSYTSPQSNFNINIELNTLNETLTVEVLVMNTLNYQNFVSGSNFTTLYNESNVINTFIELTLTSTGLTYIIVENENTEAVYIQIFLEDQTPESNEPITVFQPIYSGEIFIVVGILLGIITVILLSGLVLSRIRKRSMIEQMRRNTSRKEISRPSILQPSNAPAGTIKYCINCGSEVNYQENYCSYCGNRFEME